MRVISDLIGTAAGLFKFSKVGSQIKDEGAGLLSIRNDEDDEDDSLRMLQLQLKETGGASVIVLQAPSLGGNVTLTLPDDAGSPGYFLQTDGSGVLGWAASSSSGLLDDETDFNQASSSPLTMFTPPANARISRVVVDVESAASAGNPTLLIGVAGDTDRYMNADQNNLRAVGVYEVAPHYEEDGTPDAIIATISADSQTFSGRIHVYFSNPS